MMISMECLERKPPFDFVFSNLVEWNVKFFMKLIFYMFKLFWYTGIKNNFFKIYYFNVFLNKKLF